MGEIVERLPRGILRFDGHRWAVRGLLAFDGDML